MIKIINVIYNETAGGLMAMRTISITGVDGTGKTTLVNRFKSEYRTLPHKLFAFNIAQHFVDENLPHSDRGRFFDVLNRHGDATNDAGLKSASLFLIMTLFGDLWRFGKQSYNPEVIITERQCVVDCLVYAKFYLPQIANLVTKMAPDYSVFAENLPIVNDWLKVVGRRWSPTTGWSPQQFGDLLRYMGSIFDGDSSDFALRLERVFNSEPPDDLVLLIANRATLERRMADRKIDGRSMEPHETAGVLIELQGYLEACAKEYQSKRPGMRIHRFAVDESTTEGALYDRVKESLGITFV